ncbi:MAG: TadE/TadG family type IV pilus assembly protein [Pseudomonadota bacterium]
MTPRLAPALRRFLREQRAAATVEFVMIFVPLIVMIFFIFEMAMAYHWALAAQKGVENGVRFAVTQTPLHDSLIANDGTIIKYEISGSTDAGDLCYFGSNCTQITSVTCVGGASLAAECDAARMSALLSVVSEHAYGLDAESLTITYDESGLGRATETVIPIVTVSISAREFPLGLSLLGIDTRLPAVSATLVAENMGS